jgi:hypothetical protein
MPAANEFVDDRAWLGEFYTDVSAAAVEFPNITVPADGIVYLDWNSGATNVTFNVYRHTSSPVPQDAAHRIAAGHSSSSFVDESGQVGNYYVVTALNSYGESGPSNTAKASGGCTGICPTGNDIGPDNQINSLAPTPGLTLTPATATVIPPTVTPTATPVDSDYISGVVRKRDIDWYRWPQVEVMLWDEPNSTLLSVTQTDDEGVYMFSNVPAGTYNVHVCGFEGTTEIVGQRTDVSPPNPYVDVFALSGSCPVPTTPPSAPGAVTIYAAGTPGNDDTYPTMQLRIKDQVVATYSDVRGDPGQRQFQVFTYVPQFPQEVAPDQVQVAFVNDDGPRNLVVDKVMISGEVYESEAPTTFSTGTWSSPNGCDDGAKQSEVLSCNGYFQYGIAIRRASYRLGGQPVAVRVTGEPAGSNGLFYLYTDHLGSASAVTDASGALLGGVQRFYPFGAIIGCGIALRSPLM